MAVLMDFVSNEYKPSHSLGLSQVRSSMREDHSLIHQMLAANVDSEEKAKFKKQAYITLSNYFDMLKRADSLKQLPSIGDFQ
jgi:hypothetical protein